MPEAGEGAMAIGITQWYVPLEDGSDHPFTPIFTSQTAVDKAIELMKSEGTAHHGVMTLDAETLFQVLLPGSDMALNPNSNMSKSLDADEVRLMLSSLLELAEHLGRSRYLAISSSMSISISRRSKGYCRTIKPS